MVNKKQKVIMEMLERAGIDPEKYLAEEKRPVIEDVEGDIRKQANRLYERYQDMED